VLLSVSLNTAEGFAVPELDEETMPVANCIELCRGSKVPAVYGVFDIAGQVKYIGITQDLGTALTSHLTNLGQRLVHTVCVTTFLMFSKDEMDTVRASWVKELGYIPVGNTKIGKSQWSVNARVPSADAVEQAAVVSPFDAEETVSNSEPLAPPLPAECKDLDLTIENVDKVLEEVRPFLIADGGNIKVVTVVKEIRQIQLSLQGACGSCPSSTVTMQMGVERVLRENFTNLGEIAVVEDPSSVKKAELSEDLVNGILDKIRPAMKAMGAMVEVVSAQGECVELRYQGPEKVKSGVELTLKDNPMVKSVVFV